ncbi:MAG: cold shock domain-containing protein [Bacteroidales bacterium]|nr:cold shock domain-containing protein [Bacteroidales bacterium]MBN2764163.1 cold shock domain-containing protein [Bacteroidales bacterium]
MAKTQQTWNKKEKEKKRLKKRDDKAKKKEARKANIVGGGFDNMIAYVDEQGNISSTPPDPAKKEKIIAENIEIGVPRKEEGDTYEVDREGIVTFFNDSKGYGFIKDRMSNESIFVHINALKEPVRENDRVTFQVEKGKKGLAAINVRLIQ